MKEYMISICEDVNKQYGLNFRWYPNYNHKECLIYTKSGEVAKGQGFNPLYGFIFNDDKVVFMGNSFSIVGGANAWERLYFKQSIIDRKVNDDFSCSFVYFVALRNKDIPFQKYNVYKKILRDNFFNDESKMNVFNYQDMSLFINHGEQWNNEDVKQKLKEVVFNIGINLS